MAKRRRKKKTKRKTKRKTAARSAARTSAVLTPGQLKGQTVKTLLAAHRYTLGAEYKALMKDQTPAVKSKAAKMSFELLWAAQDLQAKKVREIREKLEANEKKLKDGVKSLNAQLNRLRSIAKFLEVAGKVIGVVGRIIAL